VGVPLRAGATHGLLVPARTAPAATVVGSGRAAGGRGFVAGIGRPLGVPLPAGITQGSLVPARAAPAGTFVGRVIADVG
jgi:hypothetical protein